MLHLRKKLINLVAGASGILCLLSCQPGEKAIRVYNDGEAITLSKTSLEDKIKGGWAGQVIGCTYGGPTEFQWCGTMIGDHITIEWDDTKMKWWYDNAPGLYDDIYMDLTFVQVFEDHGLNAPDSIHALAFAHAGYGLDHANQAARYNILNGIMPPESGDWRHNPHADCIDFQIEADFAGLMAPGMPRSAVEIGSSIGHIMNDGDGVYGGLFVASMYSLAFVYDDIELVVTEALKTIPAQSKFYQTINDVVLCYQKDPADWKKAWLEVQRSWTVDKGCPNGAFRAFNIDATVNAAYIAMGLLFGEGDFGKTVDISTRAGQDSDCNPSNAAGILGTMLGYNQIPAFWKQGLDKVEDIEFSHTDISLNDVYAIGYRHAVEMIQQNGGSTQDTALTIRFQSPATVAFEESFPGIYPLARTSLEKAIKADNPELTFDFDGCGFAMNGQAYKAEGKPDILLEIEVFVDGKLTETLNIPTEFLIRKRDIAFNFELPEGKHTVTLKAKNVPQDYWVHFWDMVTYSTTNPGSKAFEATPKKG